MVFAVTNKDVQESQIRKEFGHIIPHMIYYLLAALAVSLLPTHPPTFFLFYPSNLYLTVAHSNCLFFLYPTKPPAHPLTHP